MKEEGKFIPRGWEGPSLGAWALMKELLTFIDSAVVKAYKFITKVTIEAGFIVSLLFRK